MAASIRCRSLHKIWRKTLQNFHCRHGSSSSGAIIIMVPQVPPDTAETNPIMQYNQQPKFSEMNTNNILTGCSKLSLNMDVMVNELSHSYEMAVKEGKKLDGNKFFDHLERVLAPVDSANNMVTLLNICDINNFPMSLGQRVKSQMSRSLLLRFGHFLLVKENVDLSNLSEDKKRLLRWYERNIQRECIDMEEGKRQELFIYRTNILRKEREFLEKVQPRKSAWQHILNETERDVVMLLPPSVRKSIAYDKNNYDQGPWRLNMLESVYQHFMEVCPRRDLREILWMGKHLMNNEDDADVRHFTHDTINTLMDNRHLVAKKHGFKNFAEYTLVESMAGNVENVFVLLNSCREHFLPMAKKELDDLQNFATSKTMYLDLELWDIAFYRRLHAQELFRVNKYDKLPYFNVDNVLATVIGLAEKLFQLKFTKDDDIESIHPECTAYTCEDANSGELLGQLHIDPYKRYAEKIVYNGSMQARGTSEKLGLTPITFLLMNLHRTNPDVPCFISYKEVLEVFKEFGSGLQCLLARGETLENSNMMTMDRDMIYMVGFVMEQFAQRPNVIEDMSAQYLSGDKLPKQVIDNLIKCQKHMVAYDMCCSLYESAYDIELHTGDANAKPFKSVFSDMYDLFMPTRLNDYDSRWHSEEMLFGIPNIACAYYTRIWSQMIAANVWEEFELAGLDDMDKMAVVGKKFRDTFLMRATRDSSALFREFKGMDPSHECLFKLYPMPTEK